jgi:hypothetical protein
MRPEDSYHRSSHIHDTSGNANCVQPRKIVGTYIKRQNGAAIENTNLPRTECPPPRDTAATPITSAHSQRRPPAWLDKGHMCIGLDLKQCFA